MSRHRFALVGSLVFAAISLSLLIAAGPREQNWQEVNDAMNAGLPKTAIEKLEPIIDQAMSEKKYAEAIKAIALKIRLEGNRPEDAIKRLRAEIDQAPAEMRPVMQVILANWYWNYFQQNRWRFVSRTRTDAPPNDDFTTWDLPRILREIDRHFDAALANEETLKKIQVAEYDDLLEKGNAPDAYRPTLFDVLANNALDFYMSGEQAGSQVVDAFELTADSPIFATATEFINWQPDSNDENSLNLKAIRLFQRLLALHQNAEDRSAFLDADLARLVFGNNQASGSEKAARFKAALRRFADQHADQVISSRALHQLASVVHQENDWLEAHKIANEGLQRHSDSVGGRRCFNLIQQIEAKSLGITTERVWNEPLPTIEIAYRNIAKVHFRLVPYDFNQFIRSNRWQPEQLDPSDRTRLLSARPLLSWSEDLPETKDFQERVASFSCPDDLAIGSYFLIASHNAEFNDVENVVSFTEIWRSDLALVVRSHQGESLIDGFVLDANSGEPIPGATIRAWRRGNRNAFSELPQQVSDENGRFEYPGSDLRQVIVLAKHGDQILSSTNPMQSFRNDSDQRSQQTMLFTDRAIYRPGQSIHFKGICVSLDPKQDDYKTLAGHKAIVAFLDVNGNEIERLTLRTNDYGSFSGTVTAPRDRLMGQMSLSIAEGPPGAVSFSVEEYKRPKFQVEIDAPAEQAKLLSKVRVEGRATAYTGASINDANVQWRVVREVRYPAWWYWRCWWLPPSGGDSQEIAFGTSLTDAAGKFEITFEAKPDPSAPRESEPVFQFTIHADVTDSSGETRSSSRVVNLGYAAISASLSANDWLTSQDPVEIRVQTKSLDGEPRGAKGSLQVFSVKQPEAVTRPPLAGSARPFPAANVSAANGSASAPPPMDPANPSSWPLGELVHQTDFETDASGSVTIPAKLTAGMYRVKLLSRDAFGNEITAELPITVIDPQAEKLNIKIPELFTSQTDTLEPGEEYRAVWGSGYDSARVFVEVVHRGKLLQSYWTKAGVTQATIRQKVSEAMRGGFQVRTTMVRENRAYTQSRFIDVPWTNKQLTIRWEHFVSKLEPGAKEIWTAIISGSDSQQAVAEMVATMYDASLDTFRPHAWPTLQGWFRRDQGYVQVAFENQLKHLQQMIHSWTVDHKDDSLVYRHLPASIVQGPMVPMARFGRGLAGSNDRMMLFDSNREMSMEGAMPASAMPMMAGEALGAAMQDKSAPPQRTSADGPAPDLSSITARRNLNETAFFFPHLMSDEDGVVKLQFTMPEALTEWRFLGFAHDRQLRSGLLTGTTVTAKDLMVQPNPPRFLREGDTVEFTVKISNQSPTRQSGTARLTFNDARSGDSVDEQLGNASNEREFDLAAGESMSLAWRLNVPDGMGFLSYKAVGSTGRLSDGEEGMLPVLSRRVLVTESLPLPIRGQGSRDFRFEKLLASGASDSLQHQSVTLQMVSNPSWYAVMALPYLMEFPHECSEQVFNRLYANALARHLAQSDPKIERIFEQWRATPALDSPLEKNEDLKGVMIAETPWVRQAESESQSRRNVGILFDNNRLDEETSRAIQKLTQMQLDDGAWPWFPAGGANDFITLYVTTGFGRLRHLGIAIDTAPAVKSLTRLDRWMTKQYQDIKQEKRAENQLSATVALYLYGRSFFLQDQPIAAEHRDAWNYWITQAKTHWLALGNRQSQAHAAIALKRVGETMVAKGITDSLKERSQNDDEMGMYWRDLELSWWWYRAPIETQAMMIEAFDEVADDQQAVEDCKLWLLKQKQTQDWKTTKATADAVYALLLRGSDLLASNALVEVTMAGLPVPTGDVEAGTGFFEHRWTRGEITPSLGEVTVKKVDEGVAWGGLHWQYLEDVSKITPHAGTPLNLTKQLFVKKNSPAGPTLQALDGPVEVGDELVVRLVVRADRDMEFIHLRDHRGSGTEPVNVLSQYRFRDGLAYYESTRDTASHFFIDYLPKGTYVFEYSTRVQLRGSYQTGFASIQSMYAPEFNGHSESLEITAK